MWADGRRSEAGWAGMRADVRGRKNSGTSDRNTII